MSEFWKRKMKTYFTVKDVNKDGIISAEDYEMIGEFFCDREKASPERRQHLKESLQRSFKALTKAAGADKDEPLTEALLIESVKQNRGDPGFRAILNQLAYAFMDVTDSNEDGFIQEDEHRRIFENMGLSDDSSIAKIAFDAIDTNHDGKLSKDELARAYVEFMVSEDEKSPYQFFWGPLA